MSKFVSEDSYDIVQMTSREFSSLENEFPSKYFDTNAHSHAKNRIRAGLDFRSSQITSTEDGDHQAAVQEAQVRR